MPLTSGTRLGPFELVAPIGAGGMGEVYKARDNRLQRDVAIKILPSSVTTDPDRRARFEREAHAIAALNHPNILAIYEVGESDGIPYIVTELLEGETLRARLDRGMLPARKAVDIGVQIARGLAAAHDKGLVHRDLKPENLFLLEDGQTKILDFGLARPAPTASGATATAALTDPGTTLGTVGYMAPEQVRGLAVDARADLFALGAVLFEMLTGRHAFHRATAADTISAILNQDPPDISAIRGELPPALEPLVRHCLEKNASERFQTARDVAFALTALSWTNTSVTSGRPYAAAKRRRWPRLVTVGLLVAAAVGAVVVDRAMRPAPNVIRFEEKTWDPQWITNARFGPDGQTIFFSAAPTGNVPRLFVIRQGTVVSEPLGEPQTQLLSVSSKGDLAVLTGVGLASLHRLFRGTLARMTIDGGARPLASNVSEADWSPDGSALAVIRLERGSPRLEYPIGQVLHRRAGGYLSDVRVSPDGDLVAFFDHDIPGDDRGSVRVVDRRGAVRTVAGPYSALQGLAWSPDGRSVYFSGSGAEDDSYEPQVADVGGRPAARQLMASAGGMLVLDVARDGRLLGVRADTGSGIRVLVPGEASEREMRWLNMPIGGYLSPDGRSLLFTDQHRSAGPNYAVALHAIDTDKVVRLGEGLAGGFSPDGQWATGWVPSSGDMMLYPVGAGEPVKLVRAPLERYNMPAQWFPDGRRVLVCGNEPSKPPRCYEQGVPSGAPKPVTPEGVLLAVIAHDGRTLLMYTTARTAQTLVIGAGAPQSATAITATDRVVAWTGDDRGVVVWRPGVPVRLERVDLATGARSLLKELGPPSLGGVTLVAPAEWRDDPRSYVYTYRTDLSKLFVISGVTR